MFVYVVFFDFARVSARVGSESNRIPAGQRLPTFGICIRNKLFNFAKTALGARVVAKKRRQEEEVRSALECFCCLCLPCC